MHLFSFRKLFVTCPAVFLLFFVLLVRNSKREGVGGEAKGKMHGRCIKYDNVHIYTTKNHYKASSKSKHHTFVYGSPSNSSSLIKPKSKAHGFYEALHACRLINPSLISCGSTIGFTEKLSVDCHHKCYIARHHYSNSLTGSSCNLNWFDTIV